MKKQFLFLILLGLLCSVGISWGAPTSTHIPGIYEKATESGGYGQTLTTSSSRKYEVYGFSSTGSSANYVWAGTSTTTSTDAHCILSFATTTEQTNGWISNYVNGRASSYSNLSSSAEFTGIGGYQMNYRSNSKLTIKVSGYDQFSIYAKDNSTNDKHFVVKVDGTEKTMTYSTSANVRRFDISTGEHTIEVTATGDANSVLWGFSLRLPDTYTVTYNANGATGGSVPTDATKYSSGATVTVKGNTGGLEKTGYSFAGWNTKDDGSGNNYAAGTGTFTISANTTLYAKWTINSHTLSWNFGGDFCSGTAGEDYTAGGSVAFGTAITYPADNMMSRDGFDFTGWSTDATTMPDEDLTITALWATAAAKYDITFSKGVYTAYDGAVSFPEGENASNVTLEELSSDNNYRFDGWIADVDVKETTLSGTTISAGTLIDAGTKVFVTAATTFIAQWTEKFAVSFNSNGGTSVATQYVVDGGTADEPTAPTRTNYTFGGWKLSGSAYNFSTEVDEAITLDATWERSKIDAEVVDITLVSTSATIESTSPLTGVYYGNDDKFSYTGNAKISTGGAMFGTPSSKKWVGFTIPSGYSATVTANSTNSNERHCVLVTETERAGAAGDATFLLDITTNSQTTTKTSSSIGAGSYALGSTSGGIDINSVVVHVTYPILTVTLKVMGQEDQVIDVTSGETLSNIFLSGELPTPDVPTGYTFNCWKNEDGDAVVTESTTISSSMVIYADLIGAEYNITLDKGTNGASNGVATATMGETSLDITTAAEGADGYELKGYYTATDNDEKVAGTDGTLVANVTGWTDSDGKWIKTSDATLYAQWNLLAAPTAMTITGAGTYAKNAEATLTVTEVDGAPIPTIKWYSSNADGSELSEDPVETGTTFTPSTATAGKFYYVAEARNSEGYITSSVQTIAVKPATPSISAGTTFNFANKGYAVTITNEEGGSSTLTYSTDNETFSSVPASLYATTTTTYYAKSTIDGVDSDVAELEVENTFDDEKDYVAWVYESSYSYDKSKDKIANALKSSYNVVYYDINDYKSSISDAQKTALIGNLDDADLVVITEAVAGSSKGTIALEDLVGTVPVICMKMYAYGSGRWEWGTANNEAKATRYITPVSKLYKVLDGVSFDGDNVVLFSGSADKNHIQTITSFSAAPSGNVNLAKVGDTNVAMHASTTQKYFALGLSCDDNANYNQNAVTIVKNAAAMLIAGEDLDDEVTSVSGKITLAGWNSFSSSYPLNLSTISGGIAYYASSASGDEVTLSRTSDVIPSGEGLMIKGSAGDTFTIDVAASGTAIDGNKLVGLPGGGEVAASTEGKNHYVFGYESSSVYGFYNLASALTVPAGKAYLELTDALTTGESSAAGRLRIVVEENTTTTLDNLGGEETAVKFFQDGQLYIKRNGIVYDAMGHIVVR